MSARRHLAAVPDLRSTWVDPGPRLRAADSLGVSDRDRALIERHVGWFTRNGATPASVTARTDIVRRLAEELPVDLLDATGDHLERWQADVAARPGVAGRERVSINTLGTYTAHVRSFYRWAVESELLDADPSVRLPRPRRPKGQARPIPEDDLRMLLAVAREPIRTWLMLACFMGFRAMDVANLAGESITEHAGRLIVSGVGKGGVPFRLVVPEVMEPVLRRHRHRRRKALWTTPRGYKLTPARVSDIANRFFRSQGMPYTFHQARHSFGTAMYAETKDILLTQEMMRHASPATTRIYVATSSDEAVAAADALAGRMLGGKR